MSWTPSETRYDTMKYNRCGKSGLKLPAISLGLWHNFGDDTPRERKVAICQTAFDSGITHFDLANNYGPPPGSAEVAFGSILKNEFAGLRDELIVSSKAGYGMWDGPYGEWGSRKNLIASCDQSLNRLGLDYVDIFIPTASTPIPRLKKPCWRLITSCARVGRFMWEFHHIIRSAPARPTPS
nr:aldo/keto reductase [Marinicella sp. W31]MDC2877611.1 aldo/keto reductase [Marinicella sp. W31]